MSRIAIIPARGNSKRLPGKNILPVKNQPMINYPVQAALESRLFDQIFVSTEDENIAKIAQKAGAEVIVRPNALIEDDATVVQVCLHALDHLAENSVSITEFCCIYATAIFITAKDINKSFKLLDKNPETDFVMGISKYNLHPVQALQEKNGYLESMWPEFLDLQSQQYPELVASNGTLYWARVKPFRDIQSFYSARLKGYEIPGNRVVDINTPEDYEKACRKAERLMS